MSKRRPGLPQHERDEWSTPLKAAVPLLKLLAPNTKFVEPCCGDKQLIGHLVDAGHVCAGAYDLPVDARTARYDDVDPDAIFISNPPWRRRFEPNRIIANLSDQRPSWMCLYTDWLFCSHAVPYLPRLRVIAGIGRVQWVPNSESGGYENAFWGLFDKPDPRATVRIVGRVSFIRTRPNRRAA
jgi:hypothetical protein